MPAAAMSSSAIPSGATTCGETDADVRAKTEAAWRAGLVAIVCVGETRAEREAGRRARVVSAQIAGSIPDGADADRADRRLRAGLGDRHRADPDHRRHRRDPRRDPRPRSRPGTRILYGGSVNPKNAAEILALDEVDGALVGGASLKADDFWAIAAGCGLSAPAAKCRLSWQRRSAAEMPT